MQLPAREGNGRLAERSGCQLRGAEGAGARGSVWPIAADVIVGQAVHASGIEVTSRSLPCHDGCQLYPSHANHLLLHQRKKLWALWDKLQVIARLSPDFGSCDTPISPWLRSLHSIVG